jgi:hypothetical protein
MTEKAQSFQLSLFQGYRVKEVKKQLGKEHLPLSDNISIVKVMAAAFPEKNCRRLLVQF